MILLLPTSSPVVFTPPCDLCGASYFHLKFWLPCTQLTGLPCTPPTAAAALGALGTTKALEARAGYPAPPPQQRRRKRPRPRCETWLPWTPGGVENQRNQRLRSPAWSPGGRTGKSRRKDGLPSADRNNKATLLLTGPFRTAKSSAKDLTPLVLKLQYAKYRDALPAPRRIRLLRR